MTSRDRNYSVDDVMKSTDLNSFFNGEQRPNSIGKPPLKVVDNSGNGDFRTVEEAKAAGESRVMVKLSNGRTGYVNIGVINQPRDAE